MSEVIRHEIHESWAHAGMVEAGATIYVSYCVGNTTGTTSEQVHGALDDLERRLGSLGMTLDDVVKVTALFVDIWEIPAMEEVFRARFTGGYPARTSLQTAFAHTGLRFQLDAIAVRPASSTAHA